MNPTYIILLLTFLGFPVLGLILSQYFDFDKRGKYLKWALLFFAIHNLLFFLDLSIKGDYADYFIFSLEYLFFSLLIFLLYKSTNIFSKIFRILGTLILFVGFLLGLMGIPFFIIVSQDFEADKVYNFNSSGKTYQTRRYSFGFATLDDIRYTFKTHRRYDSLPFEKLINETDFFGFKSDLDFSDKDFSVSLKDNTNKRMLEFSSTNGKNYTTAID